MAVVADPPGAGPSPPAHAAAARPPRRTPPPGPRDRPGWSPRRLAALGLAALLAACAAAPADAPVGAAIAPGDGSERVALPGAALTVLTYRPTACRPRLLMLVFHGVGRDPAPYRAHARPLADPSCAVVVAPLFDHARFPRDDYQYGGVPGEAPGGRAIDLVMPLVAWARAALGTPDLPFVLVGHSAGAQFLDRVAAYAPPPAARILLANPSTWVLPDASVPAPFGFGGPGGGGEDALRRYLALPVSVLLGGADVRSRNLARGPEADAQGPTRLARGETAFRRAREVAHAHGWAFGWTLAVVPGVGHDAAAMLASPEAAAALGGR